MEPGEYILVGGGEHARVVLDILLSQHVRVQALFDPKYSGKLFGVDQLGEYKPDSFSQARALVAIGNNTTRKKVVQKVRHGFGHVVHSSSIVSPFVSIEEGSVICQGAIVQARAKIGKHVIINTGAQVDHDCIIEDYAHVAPGAILCGTVQVGEGALIGAGATIIPGIKIGKWAMIGAGAVVNQDVPDYAVTVGVPAKIIRMNKHD